MGKITAIDPECYAYCDAMTADDPPLLEELVAYTWDRMSGPEMMADHVTGRFLKFLVQITKAKHVLELGMYTGYSTLSIAEGLPDDGCVITCDKNTYAPVFSKSFFDRSPHRHKVDIRVGLALDLIPTFEDASFDLIFIDADKKNYLNYYQMTLSKLKVGGAMVIDDAFWKGEVFDPKTGHAQAVATMNQYIANDSRVDNVLVPIRDGIHLVFKRESTV